MRLTEHALIAVVPVIAYSLFRYRRLPSGMIVLTAVFAGSFADLVDKPLAWTVAVIPSGRMLAHSIVISVPLIIIVLTVAYWRHKFVYGIVFSWGHLTHIPADFYPILYQGTDYYWFPNIFWPIMSPNPDRNPGFSDKLPAFGFESLAEFTVLVLVLVYIAVDIRRKFWLQRNSA